MSVRTFNLLSFDWLQANRWWGWEWISFVFDLPLKMESWFSQPLLFNFLDFFNIGCFITSCSRESLLQSFPSFSLSWWWRREAVACLVALWSKEGLIVCKRVRREKKWDLSFKDVPVSSFFFTFRISLSCQPQEGYQETSFYLYLYLDFQSLTCSSWPCFLRDQQINQFEDDC